MKHIQLSKRNQDILLMGANSTGTFVEGYYYNEEMMYISEAEELFNFASWIDTRIGGAGVANIKTLWLGFKYPENEVYTQACNEVKEMIQKFKIKYN